MNPEAQRIAIAEWCGWKLNPAEHTAKCLDWICPDPVSGFNRTGYNPPDYLNDLNAMHEAEMRLDKGQQRQWLAWFYDNTQFNFQMATAPAAQRAEALLRTIGKWQE